ncbi:MAG: glycosyltransferase family 4 protein [Prevotellaceae bacterium]|jgi:glycosyltransferase involved in cell wall biosynthesis|nr:glycosyltransferase family 4 protein [Prevotellaceae bacterium]
MSVERLKILFIVPGSGDAFYCGNCFRDSLHAHALRRAGHDVTVMPLYLPLKDISFSGDTPLFFPAVSLFVAQKYFVKKKMPGWMEKLLNSDFALNMAASFSGTTSSAGLEDMTLSMITGEGGVFRRQAAPLIKYVKEQEQPDVIHISSSLIIGVAKAIRQEMPHIPVVCSLQDEEIWIDCLNKADADAAWKGIADNSRYVDRFVASSRFYRQAVEKRLPSLKDIGVVYPGVEIEKYASDEYPDRPVIGFFYRMNEADGADILAEAFVKLKRENRVAGLRLRIGGGYTSQDKPFLKRVSRILKPYAADVERFDTYSLRQHADFYRGISAISVPLRFEEGTGLYLCEAFAAGRPAVEPDTGSFREITGDAGILYSPNSPDMLAEAIAELFTAKGRWDECRKNALKLAESRYNETVQAEALYAIYAGVES